MATIYDERPTRVRLHILAAATATSLVLYFHRAVLGELLKFDSFTNDLQLSGEQAAWANSAFFWTYALCQVPAGFLADRNGRRFMLTAYVLTWSVCTVLLGFTVGFLSLFLVRFALGVAQAGAYPTCGGIVSRWFPPSQRASASSLVGAGGRFGGIINPTLTSLLIVSLGMPWRWLLILYGVIGIGVGLWFWIVSRDEPDEHPACNDAERALIAEGRPPRDPTIPVVHAKAPVKEMLTSRVMWCMCLTQFGTNIGWAIVINDMPNYLTKIKQGDPAQTGLMGSMVWSIGFIGMLFGGRITDWSTRKYGLRWGRMAPTIVTRFLAAAAYLVALRTDSAFETALAFSAITFFCDLGVPGVWAFAQDVGGKNVGAVLGWGNMFGNLGAAVASPIYIYSDQFFHTEATREGMLYAAMAGFVVSGLAALGIDSSKPLVPEDGETSAA